MSTTVAVPSLVEEAWSQLISLRQQIKDLTEAHASLFRDTVGSIEAAHIPYRIIEPTMGRNHRWSIGDVGFIVDSVENWRTGAHCSSSIFPSVNDALAHSRGPRRIDDNHLCIDQGFYQVLAAEGHVVLAAPTGQSDFVLDYYGRAVARLRAAARRDLFKVRVRDRDVDLITPMNTVAHSGTLTSAYGWLYGFETSPIHEQWETVV